MSPIRPENRARYGADWHQSDARAIEIKVQIARSIGRRKFYDRTGDTTSANIERNVCDRLLDELNALAD